jgi:predicted DNA-binding transcriptional regulator AlpA
MSEVTNTEPLIDRLIDRAELAQRVGYKRSQIHGKLKAGELPRPVAVGGGHLRWRESDVNKWLAALPYAEV